MRKPCSGDIERLRIRWERSAALGNEEKPCIRINMTANEPGARHTIDANALPGDPPHLIPPFVSLLVVSPCAHLLWALSSSRPPIVPVAHARSPLMARENS